MTTFCAKCNALVFPVETECYECGHPVGSPYVRRKKIISCPKCNTMVFPVESKCHQCGHPVGNPSFLRPKNRYGGEHIINHRAVADAIEAQQREKLKLFGIGFVVFLVLSTILILINLDFLVVILGFAGVSMLVTFYGRSESSYYELPYSRDDDGNHRCVFCGNRGIYRHGEYRSYTKYADCSKCKTNLWKE